MTEKKRGRGRPAFQLTEQQKEKIEDLAKIGCTRQEIALILDVNRSTLEKNEDFVALYKKNFEEMKASLRRTMIQKALGDRNTGMLIWLSKQYLDFSDTPRETKLREREVVLKELEFEKGNKPPTKHDFTELIGALTSQMNELFDEEDEKTAAEALEGVEHGEA